MDAHDKQAELPRPEATDDMHALNKSNAGLRRARSNRTGLSPSQAANQP